MGDNQSSQPEGKRIMSQSSQILGKPMKITMTKLKVLYLTVFILSFERSIRVPIPRELFSGQIAYGSDPFPKTDSQDKAGVSGYDPKFSNDVSTRMAKSHQHIVRVLYILSLNMDNKSPDAPASLKEAIVRDD